MTDVPIIGEDDWFETFEDARGGTGVLHVEDADGGLQVTAYSSTDGVGAGLLLSAADAHKLADLINRRCPVRP